MLWCKLFSSFSFINYNAKKLYLKKTKSKCPSCSCGLTSRAAALAVQCMYSTAPRCQLRQLREWHTLGMCSERHVQPYAAALSTTRACVYMWAEHMYTHTYRLQKFVYIHMYMSFWLQNGSSLHTWLQKWLCISGPTEYTQYRALCALWLYSYSWLSLHPTLLPSYYLSNL